MSGGDIHHDTASRRTVLRSAVGLAGATVAAGAAGTAASQSDGPDFGGWFDNVPNYDGTTVDRTGQSRVTVTVGGEANSGLSFAPPAVRVDPGTTVVWEWSGEGGAHNVVADDGTFDSGDPVVDAGTTFEHTFESEGVSTYYCAPHRQQGMKGAVVVGSGGGGGGGGGGGEPDYGGWFDDVPNFDGTQDMTGQQRVSVTVGGEANSGLSFAPPAVRVDPGTTVVWEWSGEGGAHNVVADDGTFDSGDPVVDAGTTFEYTFEEAGLYRYLCEPHEGQGMKGAVVAGGGGGSAGPTRPTGIPPSLFAFGGVLFVLLLSPLLFGSFLRYRYPEGVPEEVATGEGVEPEPAVESAGPLERVAERIGHDEFEPTGTLTLVLVYMAILAIMWVFMYFFEFLGGGPTVIG